MDKYIYIYINTVYIERDIHIICITGPPALPPPKKNNGVMTGNARQRSSHGIVRQRPVQNSHGQINNSGSLPAPRAQPLT